MELAFKERLEQEAKPSIRNPSAAAAMASKPPSLPIPNPPLPKPQPPPGGKKAKRRRKTAQELSPEQLAKRRAKRIEGNRLRKQRRHADREESAKRTAELKQVRCQLAAEGRALGQHKRIDLQNKRFHLLPQCKLGPHFLPLNTKALAVSEAESSSLSLKPNKHE